MNVVYAVDISAPSDVVFELIEDHRKNRRWMKGILDTDYPNGYNHHNPLGTRFVQSVKESNRVVSYYGLITGYNKPDFYRFIVGNSYLSLHIAMRLYNNHDKTKLVYSAKVIEGTFLARLSCRMFSSISRKIIMQHITALKKLAETETHYRELNRVIRDREEH